MTRRRIIAMLSVIAAAGALAIVELDGWQPFASGSSDEVSQRFLAGLPPATGRDAASGRGLVAASGCVLCHRADLAGGALLRGNYGQVRSANLTPHLTGLQRDRDEDLMRALESGLDEDGSAFPDRAMPWDLISHLSHAELGQIARYLRQVPPVPRAAGRLFPQHETDGEVVIPLALPQ